MKIEQKKKRNEIAARALGATTIAGSCVRNTNAATINTHEMKNINLAANKTLFELIFPMNKSQTPNSQARKGYGLHHWP